MRRKIVAGNWKMNTSIEEGKKLCSEIVNMAASELKSDINLILCPPFLHLAEVHKMCQGMDNVNAGAQNCHQELKGAFTGEISPLMLADMGVKFVILGHSERRSYFGENDALLKLKVDAAINNGLSPIFCCGEALEIRESGTHLDNVASQIQNSLFHLSASDFEKVIIAYEPIWAIGTGLNASPEQAQEMHKHIRQIVAEKYGEKTAENLSILYGGSAKPENAKDLFSQEDVDGGLIGGASLKSRDFIEIAKSF